MKSLLVYNHTANYKILKNALILTGGDFDVFLNNNKDITGQLNKDYDLLLFDHNLTTSKDIEVVKNALGKLPGAKAIIFTNESLVEDNFTDLGKDQLKVIKKPIKKIELMTTLSYYKRLFDKM